MSGARLGSNEMFTSRRGSLNFDYKKRKEGGKMTTQERKKKICLFSQQIPVAALEELPAILDKYLLGCRGGRQGAGHKFCDQRRPGIR